MNSTIKTTAIALAMGLFASGAFAAATASDTAANYTGGWSASTSPNLGSGFGAWTITDNDGGGSAPYAGTYLDLASYNNTDGVLSPSGSGGAAWGAYANGSSTAFINLSRAFTPGASGSTSLFNQTFSIGIASAGIGGAGQSFGLSVGSAFSLSYAGGGPDNMLLSVDGGAASSVAVTFAQLEAGLNVALAVSGPLNSASEGYALTISPFAGGSAIYSSSGTFDSSAYNTSGFTVNVLNTSQNDYFNNPNITAESVPEPSSMMLFGLSGLGALLAVLRRK